MKTSFEFVRTSLVQFRSCWVWYLTLMGIGSAHALGLIHPTQSIHIVEVLIFAVLVLATIAFVSSERVIDICLTWTFRLATLAFILCVWNH